MYVYLTRVSKNIVESALRTLNLKSEDYIEPIKGDECIKTDELINIIESLNYELERVNEKLEDLKDGKEL